MSLSCFFSSKLNECCTNLECIAVVRDYATYTNLVIFGPKVVQLEMKTIVNIGNIFWMVLKTYP